MYNFFSFFSLLTPDPDPNWGKILDPDPETNSMYSIWINNTAFKPVTGIA